MSLIPQNYPVISGTKLPDATIDLVTDFVRGVVVDNGNSTTDVYIYSGASPNGIPYIVKAGWCRGFSLSAGNSQIYIQFPNVPTAAGQINVTASSEPQTAFSTQVASVTVSGPVTVNGTVGVNNFPATQVVSGSVNVGNFPATQLVNPISEYPNGSTAWASQLSAVALAASITVFSSNQPAGTHLYLGHIRINGLNYQSNSWSLSTGGVFNVFTALPAGLGDVNETYQPPIPVATWTSTGVGSLLLGSGDTLIGTILIWGFAMGYYL